MNHFKKKKRKEKKGGWWTGLARSDNEETPCKGKLITVLTVLSVLVWTNSYNIK